MYIEISARKQTMYGEHPRWPPELRKITLLKRGDFKTNEFLKPNSLVAFLIKTFKTHGLQEELEKVQNRAARLVTGNYVFETGSMTGILGQLKWESLKKRRKDSRLILLYKGLKGKARIPTDDLIPKNRRCRNQHSLAFQIPSASKEAYKSSFFPHTIRDWNDLPDSLISSAEMSDDCVSKFATLVRSRD